MFKLHTIIASTRPTRVGPAIANWFHDFAKEHGKFDAQLIDLADFNLPVWTSRIIRCAANTRRSTRRNGARA